MMNDYVNEDVIAEYIEEYKGLETAIATLEERQVTIDLILRNEHNFVIGKDRLINVRG
jgi:hypothetical protein